MDQADWNSIRALVDTLQGECAPFVGEPSQRGLVVSIAILVVAVEKLTASLEAVGDIDTLATAVNNLKTSVDNLGDTAEISTALADVVTAIEGIPSI